MTEIMIVTAMRARGNTLVVVWPDHHHITGIQSGNVKDARKAIRAASFSGQWIIYRLTGDTLSPVKTGKNRA